MNHEHPLPPEAREKAKKVFAPVSEVSGQLHIIFVNLASTDSALLDSELAVVKAIREEIPTVKVVLGVQTHRRDLEVLSGTYASQQAKVETKLEALDINDVRFLPQPEDSKRTWARDIGFWANEGNTFVIPSSQPRARHGRQALDDTVSVNATKDLQAALNVDRIVTSTHPFEGGEALFTENTAYFGYEAVRSETERTLLGQELGRPVKILGNEKVSSPYPHLDSAVVFVTNDIALINDPQSLFTLLSKLTPDELKTWQNRFIARMEGKEKHHRTTEVSAKRAIDDISYINEPGMYGYTHIHASLKHESAMMDTIKEQLIADGKEVIELPGMNMMSIPFSPVNSLIDTYQDSGQTKRRIFFPSYGLARLDEAIQEKLHNSNLFSKLIPLEVGFELHLNGGGLRCVVNGLRH